MQSNYRVLIVDDVPHNVEILETTLEDKYVLATASTGEDALKIIPTFRPDLILLDIMMPGIDGYEVCQRIKADERYNFIKIILVTGKALVEERLRGYEVGADDYVTKPFVLKELEAKIRVFLNLKRSREIDRLKTDLLVLFAHETRTPLNGIIGGSDLLLMNSALDDDTKKTVALIAESGQRLLNFIDKTMFLCELKSAPKLNKELQKASTQLTKQIEFFTPEATKRDIRISLDVGQDIELTADWTMLNKMFNYLIDNAIKYSEDNGTIRISLCQDAENHVIRFSNQGEGIPAEWIDKIFDEFAVKDIVHHQKGQGLSLATSRHIMELHGGTIQVKSTLNQGATFILEFPLT